MKQDVRTDVFKMFKSGDDISVSEDGLIKKGEGNGVSKFL